MMRTGMHYIQAMPVMLLAILSGWHLYTYFTTDALGSIALHAGVLILAFIMMLASLFLRDTEKEVTKYLESIIIPARSLLLGAVCFMLGGLHFITVQGEPVFLKMGFLVLLLAFFETAGMANRFLPALSGEVPEVTRDTLKRLLANQMGMLALVFVMSVVLLYLSLMVVVGFTSTFTVALLAAVMILALAFMAMVRNI